MRLPILVLFIVLFTASGVEAQQIAEKVVPITQEPSHHLILENKYVRVFNVEVAPHFTTRVHRHDYDYVFVTLGDSDVSNERLYAEPVELKLKDGETHFTSGSFAHKAVNLADTPFHNITIEFIEPGLTSPGAGEAKDVPISADHVNSLSANLQTYGKVSVREGTFLNGEVNTCNAGHGIGPQLLVPVSQFSVKGHAGNQLEKPGEVVWLKAGECPTMLSRGDTPARFVIINFPDDSTQK